MVDRGGRAMMIQQDGARVSIDDPALTAPPDRCPGDVMLIAATADGRFALNLTRAQARTLGEALTDATAVARRDTVSGYRGGR